MMLFRKLAAAGALCAVAALAACDDDATSGNTGTLVVRMTDAPFPFDSVARVDVHVLRIEARADDATESEASDVDEDASAGGWRTVAAPDASFDLLTLRGGTVANLGQATLPTGTYRGFRLVLDTERSSITLNDGTVLSGASDPGVQWPSAGQTGVKIQLDRPVEIIDGVTTLLIDFDVGSSFVMRGASLSQNGLLFKPVIPATVQ
jgi:hypothetical protein